VPSMRCQHGEPDLRASHARLACSEAAGLRRATACRCMAPWATPGKSICRCS
jgi:hypothetical protein